jgi:hypothetical protein
MVAKLSGAGTAFTGSKATDPHYKHQVSFSGADVKAIIHIPNDAGINPINGGRTNEIIPNSAIALTGLQTLSISIYRDKSPVRSLGYVNPVGITRGGRTIAGSMIFTILQNHPLIQLNGNYTYDYNNEFGWGWKGGHGDQFFPDACPPFNLHMVFANEVGNRGLINLYGVEFTNDGTVASIEDILTENTYQWMARDMKVYHNIESYFNADGTWQFKGGFDEAGFTRNSSGGAVQQAFDKVGLFGDPAKNPDVALLQYALDDSLYEESPVRTSNHQAVGKETADVSNPNPTNTEVKAAAARKALVDAVAPPATATDPTSASSLTLGSGVGDILIEDDADEPTGTGSSSSTTSDRPDDKEIKLSYEVTTELDHSATYSTEVPIYPGSSPDAPQQSHWSPAERVEVELVPEVTESGPDGDLGTEDDISWTEGEQINAAMEQVGDEMLEYWNIDPDTVTLSHKANYIESTESNGITTQSYNVQYSWTYHYTYIPPT